MRKLWIFGLAQACLLQVEAQTREEAGTEDFEDKPVEAFLVLEDYVVTGMKTVRDTQTTFDSLGLIGETQIESLALLDFRDSLRLIANVDSVSANGGNSGFTIRGINSEGVGEPGAQLRPLSTLVIDGATQSFEGIRRGARGIWDVERIEVYRGPQSARQGRNALAGAIIVETKSPTPWWEGALQGALGSQERREGAFMLSGPIRAEELMLRIAGERVERELDIEYASPDFEDFADEFYELWRAKLLYAPKWMPGLEIEATVSDVSDSPAVPVVDAADPFARRFGFGGFIAAEIRENDVRSHVLEVRHDIDDQLRLTSTIAYSETETVFITPQAGYNRDESRVDEDWTQELLVEYGRIGPGEWSASAGVFLADLDNLIDSVIDPIPFLLPLGQDQAIDTRTKNRAVFAELTIPLMETLSLTAGARYDYEEFERRELLRVPDPNVKTATEGDFEAFLPRAVLSYQITTDQSVSLIYSEGYRAGFGQLLASPSDPNVRTSEVVDPEFLTNYEIAYRSEWLDGRLRVNANVFYYDWEDQQVDLERTGVTDPVTVNSGESRVFGGELEILWRLASEWTLGSSLGYLDTEFVDFKDEAGNPLTQFEGNEFPGAPAWSGAVWTRYDFLPRWYVAGDFAYVDESFATGNVNNTTVVKGYGVANLSVGHEREHWAVSVSVRNLFDRDYIVGKDGRGGVYVGDPRTFTLRASLRF